jgi:hypothetical protein
MYLLHREQIADDESHELANNFFSHFCPASSTFYVSKRLEEEQKVDVQSELLLPRERMVVNVFSA